MGGCRPWQKAATATDNLAERVDFYPLLLADEEALVSVLAGCEALFNTYWVRFEHGGATFAEAIERSGCLFHAASGAHVRRIVHLSVSNASADLPFPYFRVKQRLKMRFDAPIARTRSCGRR